jgi:hypothetical protein
VSHTTVGRWLVHFREAPECTDAPALPSADTLDAIVTRRPPAPPRLSRP